MTSFLEEVIADLQKKNVDFSQLTFILPSKRSGIFLTHLLAKSLRKTLFAPTVVSIEEFIESNSDLEYISNAELLFEFYDAYLNITPPNQVEPFDRFSKWAQLLIQDFNEIDRYLISTDMIFGYLTAIKEIDHWSLADTKSETIKNYISFWNRLPLYYDQLKDQLISKKKGYQGLVYRKAADNIEDFIFSNRDKKFVFVGFNALNRAEEKVIQNLLQQNLASIYWDIDKSFMYNPIHDAGHFMRSHKSTWPYFEKQPFQWISSHYASEKNIEVIGTSKNVGQVKHIGEIVSILNEKNHNLQDTAVVLGDESLLIPLLNSLPDGVDAVNITMGLPLRAIPLASLFEELFDIHKNETSRRYYKNVTSTLSHQFIKPLFDDGQINYSDSILSHIYTNNVGYISLDKLRELAQGKAPVIDIIFGSWQDNTKNAIDQCSKLIYLIKDYLTVEKSKNLLALEYLYRFNELFNELRSLNVTYHHINSISSLFSLYKELLKSETLDFKGEPLQGLQIMGMLESRVLDFETVIISSVNEGVLPAGKSNNSFIPFDVKQENGLPTYKEKDAVYTYHFYRLLQRAKNIYIIYNTEPDVLNGREKSRFITQMEIEKLHPINHYILSPNVPSLKPRLLTIRKTEKVIEALRAIALKGFSPSSLTNYIRNPIDFYYEKILGIKSYEEIEETVAANTLGNVIHETLEDFYKPLKNKFLTEKDLELMKSSISKAVEIHFKNHYKEGDITKGKNLIIFEIAKRYLHNFLNKELETLKAGNMIKIIDVEREIRVPIHIGGIDFPVFLKGTVDRVDEYNGVIRVIDYKSGKVEQNKVEVIDWGDITADYTKYSKSFQVLAYVYMLNEFEPFSNPVEGGIISFKNLQSEVFLKFTKKDKAGRGANKDQMISQETLNEFAMKLKDLIIEICNPEIDFVEKVVL